MMTSVDLDHAIEVMEAAVKFDASDIQDMMFGDPSDKPNLEYPPIREVTATLAALLFDCVGLPMLRAMRKR